MYYVKNYIIHNCEAETLNNITEHILFVQMIYHNVYSEYEQLKFHAQLS